MFLITLIQALKKEKEDSPSTLTSLAYACKDSLVLRGLVTYWSQVGNIDRGRKNVLNHLFSYLFHEIPDDKMKAIYPSSVTILLTPTAMAMQENGGNRLSKNDVIISMIPTFRDANNSLLSGFSDRQLGPQELCDYLIIV